VATNLRSLDRGGTIAAGDGKASPAIGPGRRPVVSEELNVSVGWGGTAEEPTWRIEVGRWSAFDAAVLVVDELEGRGSALSENEVDEVVGVVLRECYRLLIDQFQVVCSEHNLIGCPHCGPSVERRSPM
jgi:hypothetical protein